MNPQQSNLYETLQASVPPTAFDPIQEVVDLIANADSVIEADDRGFTLQAGDSTHRVELPGGMTKAHYHRLAPSVVDDDKAILALAVIRKAIQPKTWLDWENTKTLARDLNRMVGDEDYQGMLRAIDAVGFAAVDLGPEGQDRKDATDATIQGKVGRDRKAGVGWTAASCPSGTRCGSFANNDGGPSYISSTAFEQKGWPHSLIPNDLDPDQVVEAARVLREKTRPDYQVELLLTMATFLGASITPILLPSIPLFGSGILHLVIQLARRGT